MIRELADFLELGRLPEKPVGPDWQILEITKSKKNLEQIGSDFNYKITENIETKTINDRILNIKNNDRSLYAKIAWEGYFRETLALELNNMLTGRKIPYKGYESIIITDEVKGEWLHRYLLERLKESREYCYEYGILNEFTRILGLEDRRFNNLILKDNGEIWNIDFGQSFMNYANVSLHKQNFNLTPKFRFCFECFHGQRKGQETIKKNIENNFERLKSLLDCIDDEVMNELTYGYNVLDSELKNPKKIIRVYCKNNGWDDLCQALE